MTDRSLDPRELPVVFVHGFMATHGMNAPYHWILRREGLRTFDVPLPGINTQDMRESSRQVEEMVREVLNKTGAPQVSLVGISMGGLIALHYLWRREGHRFVRRLLCWAAPVNGSATGSFIRKISASLGPAGAQVHAGSDFVRELHEGPHPEVDIVTLSAKGDPMAPPEACHLDGARNIVSPIGWWPAGHHYAIGHPKNVARFKEELLRP